MRDRNPAVAYLPSQGVTLVPPKVGRMKLGVLTRPLLFVFLSLACSLCQAVAMEQKPPEGSAGTGASGSNSQPKDHPQLKLGELYERLGLRQEAEEHYVIAAQDPSPAVRQLALEGIRRVRLAAGRPAAQAAAHPRVRLGQTYESIELWDEAEEHYLAAAEDSSPAVRQLALDGIHRVRGRQSFRLRLEQSLDSWGQGVDAAGAWILRFFVATVLLSLLAVTFFQFRYRTGGVEIAAFATPGDRKLGSQISSCFTKVRAKLLTAGLPFLGRRRQILIPIDLSNLSNLSFEVVGFKLAGLASLVRLFLPPRFRVTGGGHLGAGSVTLHAEIWHRWRWFGYRLQETLTSDIPSPRELAVVQLENFVYAVFIKILYAAR